MRKVLFVAGLVASFAITTPAFANAPLNANNCVGSGVSYHAPGVHAGPLFSADAQAGTLSGSILTFANCGTNQAP